MSVNVGRKVLLLAGFILLCGIGLAGKRLLTSNRIKGNYAMVSALFQAHLRDRAGMPPDIQALLSYAGQSYSKIWKWEDFAYVSGIVRGDPHGLPLLVEMPSSNPDQEGLVGLFPGGLIRMRSSEREKLLREPWNLVVSNFTSTNALEAFKRRVVIVAP